MSECGVKCPRCNACGTVDIEYVMYFANYHCMNCGNQWEEVDMDEYKRYSE